MLDAWLAQSGRLAVGALREAGPDARIRAWAGVGTSGSWARRMAHEITVHQQVDPAQGAAQMADQLLQPPVGAGRHGRGQIGAGRHDGPQLPHLVGDLVGVAVMCE